MSGGLVEITGVPASHPLQYHRPNAYTDGLSSNLSATPNLLSWSDMTECSIERKKQRTQVRTRPPNLWETGFFTTRPSPNPVLLSLSAIPYTTLTAHPRPSSLRSTHSTAYTT